MARPNISVPTFANSYIVLPRHAHHINLPVSLVGPGLILNSLLTSGLCISAYKTTLYFCQEGVQRILKCFSNNFILSMFSICLLPDEFRSVIKPRQGTATCRNYLADLVYPISYPLSFVAGKLHLVEDSAISHQPIMILDSKNLKLLVELY